MKIDRVVQAGHRDENYKQREEKHTEISIYSIHLPSECNWFKYRQISLVQCSRSILAFPLRLEEAARSSLQLCYSFTVLHMTRKTANIGVKNFSVSNT
jgi:hypothetical protein